MSAHYMVFDHFRAKEEGLHQQPTSRQRQAMVESQRKVIAADRARDSLREEWRAHDMPAIREERNCHVQNWGI